MKEIEAAMSAPGFYEKRDQAQLLIDRHQTLMWELGELMHQWEELSKTGELTDPRFQIPVSRFKFRYSPAPLLTIM